MMGRTWKEKEAVARNEFLYDCVKGSGTRSVIEIEVALDGMTFFVLKSEVADECISILGGLTKDQTPLGRVKLFLSRIEFWMGSFEVGKQRP